MPLLRRLLFSRVAMCTAMDFPARATAYRTAAPRRRSYSATVSDPTRSGGKLIFDQPAAGFSEFAPEFFIVGQSRDGIGERLCVVWRHKQRIHTLTRDFAAARHISRDDWSTAGRRFEETFWKAFATRRKNRDMCRGPEFANVGDMSEHFDAGALPPTLYFGQGNGSRIGGIRLTGDQQPHRPALARKNFVCTHQGTNAFVGKQPADKSNRDRLQAVLQTA